MNELVRERSDILINNKEVLAKNFKWSYGVMHIASALVYTSAGQNIDVERLDEAKKYLDKHAGVFSSFKASAMPMVVSKMALSADPAQYFNDLKSVFDRLSKKMIMSDGGYIIQGAINILDADRLYDADAIIEKFHDFYKKMNKLHPFITGSEDIAFGILLAMTDRSVDDIINEIETSYAYLRKTIGMKAGNNEIQGLSMVLALMEGTPEEKCDKAIHLFNEFLARKVKYGNEYNELASLGILIDLDVDDTTLVDEILETEEYLSKVKGFGSWTLNKKQRLMFAAMLVGDCHESKNSTYAATSTVNSSVAAIIAEEVALMVCIMACTTTTTTCC